VRLGCAVAKGNRQNRDHQVPNGVLRLLALSEFEGPCPRLMLSQWRLKATGTTTGNDGNGERNAEFVTENVANQRLSFRAFLWTNRARGVFPIARFLQRFLSLN
jgi:hypothetical protein